MGLQTLVMRTVIETRSDSINASSQECHYQRLAFQVVLQRWELPSITIQNYVLHFPDYTEVIAQYLFTFNDGSLRTRHTCLKYLRMFLHKASYHSYSMPKFYGKPQIVCHVNNQRDTKHSLINCYWMVANNITKVEFQCVTYVLL